MLLIMSCEHLLYIFNILSGVLRAIQRGGKEGYLCGTTDMGYMLHLMWAKKICAMWW